MKKHSILLLLAALVLLLTLTVSASADNPVDSQLRMLKAQLAWNDLIRDSWDSLTPPERYAGLGLIAALGQTEARQFADWQESASDAGLEGLRGLLGNGVIDLSRPGEHDPDILTQAIGTLNALGYETPEGWLILADTAGYDGIWPGWRIAFGHTETLTLEDGVFLQLVPEYELFIDSQQGALRMFRTVPPPDDPWLP